MPQKPQAQVSLEEEIAQLRDLLRGASAGAASGEELENRLAILDSVGRAAPQLARLLKAQRELAATSDDPAALLRQALAELEEEWPELGECKAKLKGIEMNETQKEEKDDNAI